MSSDAQGPRPRQVTIGGWAVAVASLMLVVTVFDQMATLYSVDRRDALTEALTTGSLKDLGISVADALSVMRIGLFVAGVAAVVTGILGLFVLRRDTTARIVLTVAAVPVVLTAPFSGGFLAMVIGASTALLWSRPARDWFRDGPGPLGAPSAEAFAGRPPVRPAGDRRTGVPPGTAWIPPGTGATRPPPMVGWGQPRTEHVEQPHGDVSRPPTPVRVACLLTWVVSLLTAVVYLLVTVALLVDRAGTLRLLRDNPTIRGRSVSDGELAAIVLVAAVVIVGWCLAACVLAALAWRRHSWAWLLLVVSVGCAAVVELVSLPYSVLHLAAAIAALRLLLLAPTRAWFRGDGGAGSPGVPLRDDRDWAPPDPQSRISHDPGQQPPPDQPPVW